jgi:ABC-type transporter Mla MlaB component
MGVPSGSEAKMSKITKSSRKKRSPAAAAEPAVPASVDMTDATEQVVAPAVEPVAESAAPAPVASDANGAPVVVLASNCTVKDAAALKASLCAVADASAAVSVDVGNVERIDTATIQLLCAFVHDRKTRGQSVAWQGESGAWRDAIRLLGVAELLEMQAAGAAA